MVRLENLTYKVMRRLASVSCISKTFYFFCIVRKVCLYYNRKESKFISSVNLDGTHIRDFVFCLLL